MTELGNLLQSPHQGQSIRIADVFAQILNAGISSERIMFLGFSQGARLTLEFAARNARRYGGIVGFSGALIGP